MKKISILLFVLLLLAGCASSDHNSHPSDADKVLFTGPNNVSYTKDDLYRSLKLANADTIASDILDHIALKLDGIDMEAINKEADEIIETYQSIGYESYIISYYGSIDAYRKSYISSMLLSELSKAYVNEDFDHLVEEKKPIKMQVAAFDTIEDAQQCIDDTNNGSTFDMAAVNNNAQAAPQSSIYTDDDTTLVYEVKEYVNSTDQTGLSTIITSVVSSQDASGNVNETNTYYVLNIESRDVNEFKDEFIEHQASATDAETVKEHYLTNHSIEFFDQDLYEIMSAKYEAFK